MIGELLAWICLGWYVFVLIVSSIGVYQICRNFSSKPPPSLSTNLPLDRVPHVTVLRPVKGIEPHLYACLAATFQQSYPKEKLTIYLCISSRSDPAFPILEQLLSDFPGFDAKILVEEEDPNLSGKHGDTYNLGPNPKIRNMSRGYREAKGDIIWIIDCNVWVSRGVCGNMVDRLCGFTPDGKKYKFVHQLPLVIDISESLPASASPSTSEIGSGSERERGTGKQVNRGWGSLLEELFLSTSHAKFYTAISTVAVAPCIVGKSNMFRRSHLNALTASSPKNYSPGIDFFSENICEDHLIGDLLWKRPVPPSVLDTAVSEGQAGSSTSAVISDSITSSPSRSSNPVPTPSDSGHNPRKQTKQQWANHALLPHSLALQPMAHLPLRTYIARRTRWLRVRKFTVPLATLVEPGTESLLCSLYGAYGLTSIPLFAQHLGIPRTWWAFFALWVTSVGLWACVDAWLWRVLQSGATFGGGEGGPAFVGSSSPSDDDGNVGGREKWRRRRWMSRIGAWVGRESLAFGIWVWAVVGGVEVDWRGRKFWVGWDASVHEMADRGREGNGNGNGDLHGKVE